MIQNRCIASLVKVKLPESTEWALHCVTALAQVPDQTVSTARLAEHFGLPVPYLAKQLAALVRADVLAANRGPQGGFRLTRPASHLTLLDVVEAIDGTADPYTCTEIRQQGRGAAPAAECREPCLIASRMRAAHQAWRDSLGSVTVASLLDSLPAQVPARTRSLLARPEP